MPSIADAMSGMAEDAPIKQVAQEEGAGDPASRCLADLHAESGGKYMLISSDGMGLTVYQVGDDGNVQGPSDTDAETISSQIGQFFNDEEPASEAAPAQSGGKESLFDR